MEDIIAVLAQKLDLTAEEITDILWLALLQWQSTTTVSDKEQLTSISASVLDSSYVKDLHSDQSDSSQPLVSPTPSQPNTTAPLYSRPSQSPSQSSPAQESLPFPVPNATALRNSRALLRSLRPLMQRVPSQTSWILDEQATVQCIAETKLWLPQRKPKQEPWFELALVVDGSPSMLIWQRHVIELRRLLAQTGAFRDVRTWSLDVNSDGQLYLHPKLGARVNHQAPRSPQELIDPTRRRLILVVSDCISSLWQSGTVTTALKVWAEHGPMALVQMLPEWLWERTALSQVPKVRFHSLAPGMANQKLSVVRRDRWRKTTSTDIKVPVLTLEPPVTSLWSQMVAGKGNTGAPGLLFSPREQTSFAEIVEQNVALSSEERVQRFRVFSSPMARRLAGLLAACPVISLPIIRIIQDAMLRQSQQLHVAEVLLSGLFRLATPIGADTNPDEIEYKFYDEGIRGILLDSTPAPDTFSVLSKWIEQRLKKSLDDFIAILQEPQSNLALAERTRPFAGVAIEVLKRQGGKYARHAADLEQRLLPPQTPGKSIFPQLPPPQTFEFEVATITIEPDFNLQPFEFEVALIEVNQSAQISTDSFPEIVDEMVFTKTGKHLDDTERLILQGTFANQTYEQIAAASTKNSARHLSNVALKLWEVLSEVIGEKVTKRNLQNVLQQWAARPHLTIHRHRQQAQEFIEDLGNGVQLKMVAIPSGSFVMGSPEDEPERREAESPQHTVTIKSFFLGKNPVTQAQWQAVASLPQVNRELDANPSHFKGENRPVEEVSWYDAVEFCDRLSQYTGKPYRLPSEAEWEYACRAGTTTPFHFGETITSELANYNADHTYGAGVKGVYRAETTAIGSFGVANAFGLYDMHGNVFEWCADHWHSNYEGAPTDGSAWINNDNDYKFSVLRGGSWLNYPRYCRSASRNLNVRAERDFINSNVGFRVACGVGRTE